MNKFIVTGANGFIGKHVLELLRTSKHQVYALTTNIEGKQNCETVIWHEVDLLDQQSIKSFFDKIHNPTHLLHLAWDTTPGLYWSSQENLKWVQGSLSLFDHFCQAGGQRIVGTGTCAEYDLTSGVCSEEHTSINYSTTYGSCKNVLQHMLGSYQRTYQISTAWARLFYMYGPYEHPSRLVPTVIGSLLQGKTVDCTHGKQIRDYLYVKDVASALLSLLEHDLCGPINIGSGISYRLHDIINEVSHMLNGADLVKLGAIKTPEHEPPIIVADVAMLNNQLCWKPSYHLKAGINETIQWWKNQTIRPMD